MTLVTGTCQLTCRKRFRRVDYRVWQRQRIGVSTIRVRALLGVSAGIFFADIIRPRHGTAHTCPSVHRSFRLGRTRPAARHPLSVPRPRTRRRRPVMRVGRAAESKTRIAHIHACIFVCKRDGMPRSCVARARRRRRNTAVDNNTLPARYVENARAHTHGL